jgi:pyruvate dehydrogenase E2 component (dihydrolipoamide acetyltransferase)
MSDFTMPSLGADMESGTLLEWLVRPGDHVHRGDPMAVVDTDKAAIEIESFQDGVVGSFLVDPGTRVAVGTPLATVLSAEDAAAPAPAAPVPAGRPGRVSPYARKLAHQLGVDLATVHHTGPRDYVNAEDVREAAREQATAAATVPAPAAGPPAAPTAAPAPAVPAPRTGRAVVAALMSRSKREIPHYYVATTVDMHATVSWIQRTNRDRPVTERLVPAAALLRATALATRRMPELNGFWVDGAFVPGEGVHLGVAVSVRGGALVAPALHDAADLDLPTTMARLRDLVSRARTGRLTRAELADPTLTVTDLGDQGVEEVIGVIQPPQVALLGVGRLVERPWAVDGMLTVRPVVRLALSGDHRATDGYTGARFLRLVEDLLQRPEEL